jgi:hypothetical protein
MEEAPLSPSEPASAHAERDAPAQDPEVVDLMPPADSSEVDSDALRRAEVDLMVQRCLDAAVGLACRSLDPDGLDPEGADTARRLVMRAISDSARKRISADDDSIRSVMRRTAELAMDALIGRQGSATPGTGVRLEEVLPDEAELSGVAPGGRVSYAVLQDSLAAARATDRQLAYTVFAASVPLEDACTLLGIEPEEAHSAMLRIGRRLGDSQAPVAAASGSGASA